MAEQVAAADTQARAMPAIAVTYQELVTIRTTLATIVAQLQAALALQGKVENLEKRVGVVENVLAGRAGERKTWNTILAYVAGVASMAIGGGAIHTLQYLPKLLGWHP